MYNDHSVSQQQLAREKALHIYLRAFERGDFDTMDTVLQDAMHDSVLEQMILETHEYYLAEEQWTLQEEEREKVLHLVWQHLPSGVHEEEEAPAIPPLTVQDVLIRLQEDPKLKGTLREEVKTMLANPARLSHALPEDLSMNTVYRLFEQMGLAPGLALLKMFRQQAVLLAMAREQGIAQLAAARRQKSRWQRTQSQQKKDS